MQRPDVITAFLGLLGVFNLLALWFEPGATAGLYFAVAMGCFGLLLMRGVLHRRMRSLGHGAAPGRPPGGRG